MNKQTVNLSKLSKEEREAIFEQITKEKAEEQERIQTERRMLKEVTNDTIKEVFAKLMSISSLLKDAKNSVYENFATIMELKKQVYDREEGQNSDTFTTTDGKLRITLGYNVVDDYDDTAEVGIEKVKQYISSLAQDANSKQLVGAVLRLLARDQKGNLKASRVMQLSKMADESGNKGFQDAVKIIRDAYRPTRTKSYVVAKYRDEETNEWKSLPLGMTEA